VIAALAGNAPPLVDTAVTVDGQPVADPLEAQQTSYTVDGA
jgi:hypothetical protein